MKKIMRYIVPGVILAAGFAGMNSCIADLDVSPGAYLSPEYYFQDSTQCETMLVGCYDALQQGDLYNGGNNGLMTIWNVSDEMFYNGAGTGPKVYSYTSGYSYNLTMWKACYVGVQRANQFLANVGRATFADPANMNRLIGEAKFLRAFFYFTLVQNWGPVPLVTDATEDINDTQMAQTDEATIYDYIIREMEEAEKMVGEIDFWNHSGRINKSGVRAILARVCLFKAGFPCYDESMYEKAYYWAKKVIDDPRHGLDEYFAQVFIDPVQDRYNLLENLWEVEFYQKNKTDPEKEYGPSLSVTLGTNQSSTAYGYYVSCAYGVVRKLWDLYEDDPDTEYGAIDERRNWAIGPFTYTSVTDGSARLAMSYIKHNLATNYTTVYDLKPNKFNRQYSTVSFADAFQSNTGTNTVMVRYADVLLMAAEAACHINNGPTTEAVGWVNEVRKRAYGKLSGNRSFIDEITVTNPGSGYENGKVAVVIGNLTDGSSCTTWTTAETEKSTVFINGYVKGTPTVATAKVEGGQITEIILRDRGPAYVTAPTVTIRTISGSGSGATAIATIGKTFDHELTAGQTANAESFMQAIKDERARELCFEGWRRLDLKRWKDLVPVLQETAAQGYNSPGLASTKVQYVTTPGNYVSDAHYYLPIPAKELMLNRMLEQNKGW